jgi:hypothetical protein
MNAMDYRDYEMMSVEQLATIREDVLTRLSIVTGALKKTVKDEHTKGTDIKKISKKAGVTRRTVYAWLAE